MKKRQKKTLYNRALSLALAVSTTASLCFAASGVTAAMEEHKVSGEMKQEESGEPHYHTFTCYEEYHLNCTEGHSKNEHRESCYTWSGERICGLENGEWHVHNEECEAVAKILVCDELEDDDKLQNGNELEENQIEQDKIKEPTQEMNGEEETGEEAAGEGEGNETFSGDEEEKESGEEAEGESREEEKESKEETEGESREEEKESKEETEEKAEDDTAGEDKADGENSAGNADGDETVDEDNVEESKTEEDKAGEDNTEADNTEEGKTEENNHEKDKDSGLESAGEEIGGTAVEDDKTSGAESADEEVGENNNSNKGENNQDSSEQSPAAANNADSGNEGSIDSGSGRIENGNSLDEGINTAAESGTSRNSLFAMNKTSHNYPFLPQLYIDSPLNSLIEKILFDEDSKISESVEDGEDSEASEGGEQTDADESESSEVSENMEASENSETSEPIKADENSEVDESVEVNESVEADGQIKEEMKKTADSEEDASYGTKQPSEEVHQHSADCYKTIYQCRKGVMVMALQDDGIAVGNEDALKEAIEQATGQTKICICIEDSFNITESIAINTGKNIMIDLQGNTLTYTGSDLATSMITINGGNLTIMDSANEQQGARLISEEVVSEAGQVEYDAETGRLTYYVTECEVNVDGKSTTNTVRKYVYDLGTCQKNIGALRSEEREQNFDSLICVNSGTLIIKGGCITNQNGKRGIHAKSGTVTIAGGYLVKSGYDTSDGYGGGILIDAGTLNIEGGVIAENIGKAGGGIYARKDVSVNIKGGVITANQSLVSGGGVYSNNAKIKIDGIAKIIANSANSEGGGIVSYGSGSTLKFSNGCVAGNQAAKNGGGILLQDSGNTAMIENGARITNNTAINGGGLYINNAAVKLDGAGIFANLAEGNGGGIYYAKNSLEIINKTIIAANYANGDKNSIYCENADKTGLSDTDVSCFIEQVWTNTEVSEVNSAESLQQKIGEAKGNADKNESAVIQLDGSIEMNQTIPIPAKTSIILILNGHTIDGSKLTSDCLFSISGNKSSMTIRNKLLTENEELSVTKEVWNSSEEYGRRGIFDKDNNLTYFVTRSEPKPDDITHTIETTYKCTVQLDSVGAIKGNGKNIIFKIAEGGCLNIEGGMITDAMHGVWLNHGSMLMRGGCIVGCGSGADNGTSTSNNTAVDDGKSPENGAGIYAENTARIQIFDGVIAGNSTSKRGGGIFANGTSIEVRNGVIAANSARNVGGGICAQNSTVTIGEAVKRESVGDSALVISGNVAEAKERPSDELTDLRVGRHYGGGGIFTDSSSRLLIQHNAYITNNCANGTPRLTANNVWDGGGTGGGGVFACGEVVMSGSFVTANYAQASGGGIFSYPGTGYDGSITLSGGTIAGNFAEKSEGGGVRVNKTGTIESKNGNKIYITNNKTGTMTNWGGGGIFNTSTATTTIKNVLITDNEAEGFGGGIAGCNHGTNQLFVNDGGGIFDNRAKGISEKLKGGDYSGFAKNDKKNDADHIDARTPVIQEGEAGNGVLFIDYKNGSDEQPSYQDFYCSNISQVYDTMLGGRSAQWRGSGSNSSKADPLPEAFPVEIEKGGYRETSNMMGLTAHPTEEAKGLAKAKAEIYITGNTSAAHGAGVMTNGTFKIGEGDKAEEGTLTIEKKLQDIDGAEIQSNQKFVFEIVLRDEEGAVLKGPYEYSKKPFNVELDEDVDENGMSKKDYKINIQEIIESETKPDGEKIKTVIPAQVSLRAGQSLTIYGLKDGAYQITEMPDPNYQVQGQQSEKTGVIWANDGRTVVFVNVPKPTQPTEPTDPTSPTKPTDPTSPTKPTNPTDPTSSTDPTKPTDPT